MKAEVQVKTREQMLATEKIQAQIKITQAQADADSIIAQAKADAEATRLRGDAEADAIKARAAALASNQNLVELTKADHHFAEQCSALHRRESRISNPSLKQQPASLISSRAQATPRFSN